MASAMKVSASALQSVRSPVFASDNARQIGALAGSSKARVVAMAAKKKVNAYDPNWSKGFFSQGIFAESAEVSTVSVVQKLEKKRLLSSIEEAGLLSTLESLGLSLSKIESLGLLSKAESLGLLSFAESFASTSPVTLGFVSLGLLSGSVVSLIVIPGEPEPLSAVKLVLAGGLGLGAVTVLLGSFLLSALQED